MKPVNQKLKLIAQISYLLLMIWIILWHSYLSPAHRFDPFLLTFLWILPLTLPLKGIILGKPYTYAWVGFILMIYTLHAATFIVVDEGERFLAMIELLLTMISFISCAMYARAEGRAKGLTLPRLSQIEKEEKQRILKENTRI